MKKILTIFVLMILASSFAFAQGRDITPGEARDIGGIQERGVKSTVNGLENAMMMVRDNAQKRHLETVMEDIQNRYKDKLSKHENVMFEEENGDVVVEADVNSKFLGLFNAKRHVKYDIDENGALKRQARAFDFLFGGLD